eukprot:3440873-Karenia_brevis.AAC.1
MPPSPQPDGSCHARASLYCAASLHHWLQRMDDIEATKNNPKVVISVESVIDVKKPLPESGSGKPWENWQCRHGCVARPSPGES